MQLYVAKADSDKMTVFTLDASGNITGQQPRSSFGTGGSHTVGVAAG
jgi:hypothetical protein